jgi:hypothetical protein
MEGLCCCRQPDPDCSCIIQAHIFAYISGMNLSRKLPQLLHKHHIQMCRSVFACRHPESTFTEAVKGIRTWRAGRGGGGVFSFSSSIFQFNPEQHPVRSLVDHHVAVARDSACINPLQSTKPLPAGERVADPFKGAYTAPSRSHASILKCHVVP